MLSHEKLNHFFFFCSKTSAGLPKTKKIGRVKPSDFLRVEMLFSNYSSKPTELLRMFAEPPRIACAMFEVLTVSP